MDIIERNIIDVLKRLTNEAAQIDKLDVEYARRANAIIYILDKVCNDFGEKYMVYVFKKASDELGNTIGPLDYTILKKLVRLGCKVTNVKSIVSCKRVATG